MKNEQKLKVGMKVAHISTPSELKGTITKITPIKRKGFTEVGGFIEIDGVLTGSSINQNHYVEFKKTLTKQIYITVVTSSLTMLVNKVARQLQPDEDIFDACSELAYEIAKENGLDWSNVLVQYFNHYSDTVPAMALKVPAKPKLTRKLGAEWFANKSYLEQHSLSDKYFESRNPSLLTIEQVEEMYIKEHLYCVSSESLVNGNSCKKWCGDVNCLKQKSTRQQALEWWNSLISDGLRAGYAQKHLNNGIKYKSLTGREIEEIWRKECNQIENEVFFNSVNDEDTFDPSFDSSKPNQKQIADEIINLVGENQFKEIIKESNKRVNQKQFKEANPDLINAYFNKFSKEDLYKYHLPILISLLNSKDYKEFIMNQQITG